MTTENENEAVSPTEPLPIVENSEVEKPSVVEEDFQDSSVFVNDDENFLNADDKALSYDLEEAVVQQQDGLVFWSIEGLFNENGKMKGKLALRQSPPTLVIRTKTGDREEVVEILITKDLAKILSKHFDMIDKGFYGIKPSSELTLKERTVGIWHWIKSHPFKATICGITAVVIVIALISPLFQ